MNNKFPKEHRLKSPKTIEKLFLEGKTISKFPIKIFYFSEDAEISLAAFAVPKRNFKSAVDRNRIKRQLRESYRLNRHIIFEENIPKFKMLFLFLGKKKPTYSEIDKAMLILLNKIAAIKLPDNSGN